MSTGLKYKVMDDEVRMEIARLYTEGWKVGDIADAVGLHETSVYRETYAGSIKNTGAQVVKAPFSGDNKKGNGTVKTGNDLRGSKNK